VDPSKHEPVRAVLDEGYDQNPRPGYAELDLSLRIIAD